MKLSKKLFPYQGTLQTKNMVVMLLNSILIGMLRLNNFSKRRLAVLPYAQIFHSQSDLVVLVHAVYSDLMKTRWWVVHVTLKKVPFLY